MRTHVDLILSMTDKMSRLVEDNETATPTTMREFLYPLERARDFARIVSPRYADRASLTTFVELLNIYAQAVREMDRLRVTAGSPQAFRTHVQAVRRAAPQVEAALQQEHG